MKTGSRTADSVFRYAIPPGARVRSFSAAMPAWVALLVISSAVALPAGAPVEPPRVTWHNPVEVASGGGHRGPWRMNRSRFHYVDDPAVVIGRDGRVAVAWVDNRAQNVFFRMFGPESNPLYDAPVDVSGSPGTFSWLPKMVMSDDGESVFLLWQEIVFSGGSHGGEAFFSRSRDDGRTFSAPLNLSASPAGDGKGRVTEKRWNNGSLDLAQGPDGILYAAWTEYEGALWLRRSTDGGEQFDGPVRVGGSAASPARGPDLAVAPDGTVYLAWTVGEDPAADIHLAVSSDAGRSFSKPRALFPGNGHSDAPSIAVDTEGFMHLVHAESSSGIFGRYHLRHARLDPGGRVSSPPRRIEGAPGGDAHSAHFPSLAIGNDAVHVVWERFLPGERRPRGLGFTLSTDGGRMFTPGAIIPGTDDPALGSNGGLQGRFMNKLAANDAGDLAVVHSRFDPNVASRVRLIRGRISGRQIGIAAIVPPHCERDTVKPRRSSGSRTGVVYAGGNIDPDRLPRP